MKSPVFLVQTTVHSEIKTHDVGEIGTRKKNIKSIDISCVDFLGFFDVYNRLICARRLRRGTSPSTTFPCARLQQSSAMMSEGDQEQRMSFQSEGEVGDSSSTVKSTSPTTENWLRKLYLQHEYQHER